MEHYEFANTAATLNHPTATPLGSVQNALSDARELGLRVEKMVERLVGASATGEASDEQKVMAPKGQLLSMQDDAERTRRYVRDAMAALARLESFLG